MPRSLLHPCQTMSLHHNRRCWRLHKKHSCTCLSPVRPLPQQSTSYTASPLTCWLPYRHCSQKRGSLGQQTWEHSPSS
jgi:hypothetical protein